MGVSSMHHVASETDSVDNPRALSTALIRDYRAALIRGMPDDLFTATVPEKRFALPGQRLGNDPHIPVRGLSAGCSAAARGYDQPEPQGWPGRSHCISHRTKSVQKEAMRALSPHHGPHLRCREEPRILLQQARH